MVSREQILTEIKRTARENGGQPLGSSRFEKEVGISSYEWGRYWPRFGDAQREAGFAPNQLQGAHSEKFILEKLIQLTRKLKKFPTYREIDVERAGDAELPTKKVFQRLGTKQQLAAKLLAHCGDQSGFDDISQLCKPIMQNQGRDKANERPDSAPEIGEVYLAKSGRYYKIGKTKDTVRRGCELQIQLPERMDLIHSIQTDDPSGIEAYWHKRFDSKGLKGEWFDLGSADVKAFKRWKRIA